MNEQTIILFFLIVSLGVTLSLYIFKAKKQMNYMGDERWEMIQPVSYTHLFRVYSDCSVLSTPYLLPHSAHKIK